MSLAVELEAIPVELPELADRSARYGVYELRDGKPTRIAECEEDALGACLVTLAEDRRRAPGAVVVPVVGVLDQERRHWVCGLWHEASAVAR